MTDASDRRNFVIINTTAMQLRRRRRRHITYTFPPALHNTTQPTLSLQHKPPQHLPQRLRTLHPFLAQPALNPLDKILRLPPQLINNLPRILKTPFTLHVSARIPLDLFVRRLLLQDIDQDLVARVGADGVDDGEREFPFGEVLAEPLERGVARCWGQVEVVVQDLEEEPDCGDEGGAVAVGKEKRKGVSRRWFGGFGGKRKLAGDCCCV